MERDSYNENLERFLRNNANNLRMQASDKVWKNISKEMSRRRRWIGFTLSVIFLLTVAGGYYLVSNSVKPLPTPVATTEKQKHNSIVTETGNTSSVSNEPLKTAPLVTSLTNHSNETIVTSKNNTRKNPVTNLSELPVTNNQDESVLVNQNDFTPSVVDSYGDVAEKENTPFDDQKSVVKEQPPLSIESVVNTYRAKAKKFSLQVSFSPTVSYRKLGENKSYSQNASVNTPASLYSVNDAVTQKPDMGLELGLTGKYTISKNLKLTGGLQFNVSRYDIKAYNTAPTVATFRLNTVAGIDSIRTYTAYGNTGGSQSDWIQNLYLQVSMPIGVELKLAGDNNTQFGIATNVQPTYVIGDRSYLISSDYQSYAQVPGLTRHWNINTNLQTFVSYSTGKMRWQVGPQVRYQLLSSFVSKYPVKENLFDFGLRVGISLNN